MRLKDVLFNVCPTMEQIANAPAFCFSWKDGSGISAGSSAQYWGEVLPWLITERDKYLEMAYSNIALINTIATARTVLDHETRIKKLEQKIQCLTTHQGSDALPDK